VEERGIKVDHPELDRWVISYSSFLVLAAKKVNVLLLLSGGWMKPISKLRKVFMD